METPIEKWIKQEQSKYKDINNKFIAFDTWLNLLTYLGLQDIQDPKKWVEDMKSKQSLNYGGGFTEEDIKIRSLQSENEKLREIVKILYESENAPLFLRKIAKDALKG